MHMGSKQQIIKSSQKRCIVGNFLFVFFSIFWKKSNAMAIVGVTAPVPDFSNGAPLFIQKGLDKKL